MQKNKFLWHDAKIDKPATYDPVIVLTDNGYVAIASWNERTNEWDEIATAESYANVIWWSDFNLPSTWEISDVYYENDPFWK